MEGGKGNDYVIAISIVASALILAGVIWVAASGISNSIADLKGSLQAAQTGSGTGTGTGTVQAKPTATPPADLSFADALPSQGPKDAKVKVIELSDFQCPYCGIYAGREYGGSQFDAARNATGKIIAEYVNAGKSVEFIYVPVAILGQESVRANEAALCADEQGKFWAYHDYLFQKQNGEQQGAFSDANLKRFAVDLKLDTAKFNSCFDSGKYAQAVTTLTQEAVAAAGGSLGTPTTFINGQKVEGIVPYQNVKALIDAALAS